MTGDGEGERKLAGNGVRGVGTMTLMVIVAEDADTTENIGFGLSEILDALCICCNYISTISFFALFVLTKLLQLFEQHSQEVEPSPSIHVS